MKKRPQNARNKKKHIVYCITKSNFGGAQKYLYDHAVYMQKKGYRVTVLAGSGSGMPKEALGVLKESLAIHNILVHAIPHMHRAIHPLHDIRAFWEIYRACKTHHPDVLHAMSSKAGVLATLAGRMTCVPRIIFTVHGLPHEESWRIPAKRMFFLFITWITHLAAHKTIHLTQDATKKMSRMYGIGEKKVTTIANGIADIAFFTRSAVEKTLKLPKHPHAVRICTIAELTHNKNIFALLDAILLLHTKKKIHAHLSVIGDGELMPLLMKYVQEKKMGNVVTLHGNIKGASRYLRGFDTFVLPSIKEGMPYTLLEAGLAEIPIVASDLPTIRELLEHGTYGTQKEPTAEGLADGIYHTIHTDTSVRTKAFAAHVRTHFSLTRMCEKTRATYEIQREKK